MRLLLYGKNVACHLVRVSKETISFQMDTEIDLLILPIHCRDEHEFLFDHPMFFSSTELQLVYVSGAFGSSLIVHI